MWQVTPMPTLPPSTSPSTASAEYFTIDGIRVDAAGLAPGIYLVRRGNTVSKTVVR